MLQNICFEYVVWNFFSIRKVVCEQENNNAEDSSWAVRNPILIHLNASAIGLLDGFEFQHFQDFCWVLGFGGICLFVLNATEQQEFSLFCLIQKRTDLLKSLLFQDYSFPGSCKPTGLFMEYRLINFKFLI